MDITSETSTILDLPPSAVAFCPSHPDYYVVGTYFLHPKEVIDDSKNEESSDEAPQKRTGTLVLYRLEGSAL
jgi:diphthamide biosynthesis protein 7